MDSHSISRGNEGASGSNINGESESPLSMDHEVYAAAAKGEVGHFTNMADNEIKRLATVTNNTILHINIAAASSTNFVREILDRCPSLLLKVNAKGDTLFHVAAKFDRAEILEVLINKAKVQHNNEDDIEKAINCMQMIGMLNNENNTALHEAVRYRSLSIVEILIKEWPKFPYSTNNYGETPLYMAVVRRYFEIVAEILDESSWTHQGPNGKTALHAEAALGYICNIDVIEKIVQKKKSLITETDQYGWTPLHYAAYSGNSFAAKQLLEYDRSVAKIVDKDRKMTPLHLAAAQGYEDVVDLIISECPECCELVDDRGWNVLHFAVLSFNAKQLKNLLKKPLVRILMHEKDFNWNTPLHVLAALCGDESSRIARFQGDYYAVNKQNRSAEQIMDNGCPELKQEIQELSKGIDYGQYPNGFIKITEDKRKETVWQILDKYVFGVKEAAESQLVVAALIATVTFAAGFTLPGGYRSEEGPNQGTAMLSRKSSFQAFVITNAIAMVLSLSAVFIHFIMSLKAFKDLVNLFVFALLFTLVAIIAMVIAFITGTYAALSPSLGLAISTCFIGLSFFFLIFFLLYNAFRPKVAEI